jgi:hypothetical protein
LTVACGPSMCGYFPRAAHPLSSSIGNQSVVSADHLENKQPTPKGDERRFSHRKRRGGASRTTRRINAGGGERRARDRARNQRQPEVNKRDQLTGSSFRRSNWNPRSSATHTLHPLPTQSKRISSDVVLIPRRQRVPAVEAGITIQRTATKGAGIRGSIPAPTTKCGSDFKGWTGILRINPSHPNPHHQVPKGCARYLPYRSERYLMDGGREGVTRRRSEVRRRYLLFPVPGRMPETTIGDARHYQ